MNPFICIFQEFCLDFKSFAVVFKTFRNAYFPEHLSMAASVCVETVLSKLLRLLFKDVLLRNHNRKQNRPNLNYATNHLTWEKASTLASYYLPTQLSNLFYFTLDKNLIKACFAFLSSSFLHHALV